MCPFISLRSGNGIESSGYTVPMSSDSRSLDFHRYLEVAWQAICKRNLQHGGQRRCDFRSDRNRSTSLYRGRWLWPICDGPCRGTRNAWRDRTDDHTIFHAADDVTLVRRLECCWRLPRYLHPPRDVILKRTFLPIGRYLMLMQRTTGNFRRIVSLVVVLVAIVALGGIAFSSVGGTAMQSADGGDSWPMRGISISSSRSVR